MRRGVPLRYVPLLLLGLAISAGGGRAFAALDLTTASVSMTIERAAGIGNLHTVELRVQGTEITSATITPPGVGATAMSLPKTGNDFVLLLSFDSEAALNTAIPNGTYRLDLNGGSRTGNIDFARLNVPSPAISAPAPTVILLPGPIEVAFAACSLCTGTEDSVTAKLEQGATSLATATLAATDHLWTPSDGMAPLELAEDSAFTVGVRHFAVRETALTASGNDAFKFRNSFIQSDEVDFATGFAPAQGAFCIVANDTSPATLDPLGECLGFVDLALAIVDTSGSFSTVAGGVDVDYDLQLLPDGKLAGVVMADVDGDAFKETSAPLEGQLRGPADRLRQRIKFRLGDAPPELKLNVLIEDAFSILSGVLSQVQRTRGVLAGARIREEIRSTLPLDDEPLGWRFDFELTDGTRVENASIRLENGRTFPLWGNAYFDPANGRSLVQLAARGADEGVRAEIRSLGVDEVDGIVAGKLFYKILGQKGETPLR